MMVSVVIISYNTKEHTLRCLASVMASKGIDMEVIVVDNASTDGSTQAIKKQYKKVKIIQNKSNLGFGKANNQGMKIAKGEYILLLNSDCFVKPDTLDTIFKIQDTKSNIDVMGCKLLSADGALQQSWGYFPTLRRIAQMMLFVDNLPFIRDIADSIHVRSLRRYEKSQEVDWVTGAFMFLKREVFEKTGGFDEHFFMYGEEIEWQYRIKNMGFGIWYVADTQATHLIGASSPTRAPAVIGEIEGWKYWFAKYHPGWQEKILRVIVFIGCVLRIFLKPKWSKYYRNAIFALSRR